MFTLQLFDRNGNALKVGDIVKISDRRRFTFYAEVKFLEDEQVITPFHTFSFHSFEKVDSVPGGATESNETRYKIWYFQEDAEEDCDADSFNDYLMSWRECEHLLDNRCYRIAPFLPPSERDVQVSDTTGMLKEQNPD